MRTRKVRMMKTVCVFLFVCVSLQFACQSGSPCGRPKGEIGCCILFKNCEYYVKLLDELGVMMATDILKKAHCGFDGNDPKVCCPSLSCSTAPTATESSKLPAPESRIGIEDYVPAFLEPPACGLSGATSDRVIGGENAELDDYPWMALLGYNSSIGTDWMCGGTLISVRHVLTAAHCIHNLEHRLYVVRLGELDLARDDEGAYPIDVLIKNIVEHEQYDANNHNNDIGVLTLQNDVQFTNSIRPICIPKDEQWESKIKENLPVVAGWGRTAFNGIAATHLQVLQLPIRANTDCAEAYQAYKSQVFDQRVICAGYKDGEGACHGDSGGPLMLPVRSRADKQVYFFEIGIVSYARGCALKQFPSVYTRVTQFLPWIQEKVLGYTTG